jgi:hypothetical protein
MSPSCGRRRRRIQARLPYELIYRMQKTEDTLALTYTNLTMYPADDPDFARCQNCRT